MLLNKVRRFSNLTKHRRLWHAATVHVFLHSDTLLNHFDYYYDIILIHFVTHQERINAMEK